VRAIESRDLIGAQARDVVIEEADAAARGPVEAVTQLKIVVLPAPLGPISPWMRPVSTVKLTPSTARKAAEVQRQGR